MKKYIDYRKRNYKTFFHKLSMLIIIPILAACEDFVEIDPPRTELVKSTVFASDMTADAAMMDVYYEMRTTGFASGSTSSITYYGTFSADEQLNYGIYFDQEFNDNELSPDNPKILSLWSELYKTIYKTNVILEGILASNGLSAPLKEQLTGEAKFVRAFCHFYLVNLFGDVPLAITSDYRVNAGISRTPSSEVYHQIVEDLTDAKNLLPEDYSFAGNERARPNRSAATALLARVYLHIYDWNNAETEATSIIQNTEFYSLVEDLNAVFLKNNTEAIFQLACLPTSRPGEYFTFRVFAEDGGPTEGAFRPGFVDNFEDGDQRRVNWVRSVAVGDITYFYPGKYKVFTRGEEYSTLFRLAEIFLIRAEARAQKGDIEGAQSDLNVVRERAGLGLTPAADKESLLSAIEHERVVELFTEQGLRWLDLKRTNKAEVVLAPIKGSTWQSTDVLYPIPEYQLLNDPAMRDAQNPGY